MFMDRKIQDVSSAQLEQQIQCNPNQNPIYNYQQTDFKVYMERHKIQDTQYNFEVQERNCRTDTTPCQDILSSESNQDSVMVLMKKTNRSESPEIEPYKQSTYL